MVRGTNVLDTAHLLVTGTLSRRSLYVEMSRGRESNTAHIVTGNTAPPGHPAYQQASPESVVKPSWIATIRTCRPLSRSAGITDPGQAIALGPHRGNPERDHLRQAAICALEIQHETEITLRMTQGKLEARILDGDRAQASAPSDVFRELRLTAQAETDAWQQATDAEVRHDSVASAGAKALARHMARRGT